MNITMENVLPLLKAAVDTRGGNYRYTEHYGSCVYVDSITDEPLCLIGVLLVQNGANPKALSCNGSVSTLFMLQESINWDGPVLGVTATDGAQQVMRAAQVSQDTDGTWGEAYRKAVAMHESLTSRGVE